MLSPRDFPGFLLEGKHVLLSICPDIDRLQQREQALTAVGFRVVSVSTPSAATAISKYWQFSALVIDDECSEISSAIKSRAAAIFSAASGHEEKLVNELLTRLAGESRANCHPLKKSDLHSGAAA